MPLYSFVCDHKDGCMEYHEVTMSLKDKGKYDRGKLKIDCPNCGKKLRPLICPVRLSSNRATAGY